MFFHGTDIESALDIYQNGINRDKCTPGYFGKGFYVSDDYVVSARNHAGREGAVVVFRSDSPVIIDGGEMISRYGRILSSSDLDLIISRDGVSACKDSSMGGLCFYDYQALSPIAVLHKEKAIRQNKFFDNKDVEAKVSLLYVIDRIERADFSDIGREIAKGLVQIGEHLHALKRNNFLEETLCELKERNGFVWTCIEPAIREAAKDIVVPPKKSQLMGVFS